MKKLIALLLVVGVVVVSMAGCQGGTTQATKTSGPGGASGTTSSSKP